MFRWKAMTVTTAEWGLEPHLCSLTDRRATGRCKGSEVPQQSSQYLASHIYYCHVGVDRVSTTSMYQIEVRMSIGKMGASDKPRKTDYERRPLEGE
jgi:hypothetical protein